MATSILRNGYFHALEDTEDREERRLTKSVITLDRDKYKMFEDSETARYIFVSLCLDIRHV